MPLPDQSGLIEVICPACRQTLQTLAGGGNAARHTVPADLPCRACRARSTERERIVAEIRGMADEEDYGTMCSWRNLADRLASDHERES